jgi:hypothetical protein
MFHGIRIHSLSSTAMVSYSDIDLVGCPDTRRLTFGYRVFPGDTLVSGSSKRQMVVSRSSGGAEYRGVTNATVECHWLKHLLQELHVDVHKAIVFYCDNVSVVYLSRDSVHHR